MKYAPAALPTDIMAKAVMKKSATTRSGRLWKNSVQRSLTFTFFVSLSAMTTRSFVCVKQKTSRAKPTRA